MVICDASRPLSEPVPSVFTHWSSGLTTFYRHTKKGSKNPDVNGGSKIKNDRGKSNPTSAVICRSLPHHKRLLHHRAQKKTTSVSLTIRSASPKTPDALPHRSTLVQALSQPLQRVNYTKKRFKFDTFSLQFLLASCLFSAVLQVQSPVSSLYSSEASGPPVFTKVGWCEEHFPI